MAFNIYDQDKNGILNDEEYKNFMEGLKNAH